MDHKFLQADQLTAEQRKQYDLADKSAFPAVISESTIVKQYFPKLQEYFPTFQRVLLDKDSHVIGFINTIPFNFEGELDTLPDRGWDWMFERAVLGFENQIEPNYLGGLQVIISQKYRGQGYSKPIINHAKSFCKSLGFRNLIIPIRPTRKHELPSMSMETYMELTENEEIYDPWIRTHVRSGAQIIKICEQSMIIEGDIKFWSAILGQPVMESGQYQLDGALSLVMIDSENDHGQYIEPNIWIKYDM